jgi:hypothetical protein
MKSQNKIIIKESTKERALRILKEHGIRDATSEMEGKTVVRFWKIIKKGKKS